ncbi:hypothetical protein ACFL6S_32135 [Candidatus Poribacteria bacterium]
MTDPDCILGIIIITFFVFAIVDTICVIIERRRKKRLTQPRRNVSTGWAAYSLLQKCCAERKPKRKTKRDSRQGYIVSSTTQKHGWERKRQPEIRRSEGPVPEVKVQLKRYIRKRFKELLQ